MGHPACLMPNTLVVAWVNSLILFVVAPRIYETPQMESIRLEIYLNSMGAKT